jgi:peroxiredoxin Q/BCP
MHTLAKLSAGLSVLSLLVLAWNANLDAQEKGRTVKVGDKAPSFEGVDESGKTFKSASVVGNKVLVLYFYPADFTGGCTKQACGFRDDIEKLAEQGVIVCGVSGDSVSTHQLFKKHHKLNFTLLADEKGELAKKFGVPVGKGGKSPTIDEKGGKGSAERGVTISRWTIVIDKAGNIAAIDTVGDAGGDAKRIAELVKNLK